MVSSPEINRRLVRRAVGHDIRGIAGELAKSPAREVTREYASRARRFLALHALQDTESDVLQCAGIDPQAHRLSLGLVDAGNDFILEISVVDREIAEGALL